MLPSRIFRANHVGIYAITHAERFAIVGVQVLKITVVDDAFALAADIDQDFGGRNPDDRSFKDAASLE